MCTLLVTVGTTEFDELIKAVDTLEIFHWLISENITQVTFQIGKGFYEPCILNKLSKDINNNNNNYNIIINWFRFTPNLSLYIDQSTIIFSHGGAGTIIECLERNKLLCIAVNKTLMDDHQIEMAIAMKSNNLCTILSLPLTKEYLIDLKLDKMPKSLSQDLDLQLFPSLIDIWTGLIK